ncbi:IS66 Orf2 family protein, partial (plasmid) [Rhizobium sp. CCGE 510]
MVEAAIKEAPGSGAIFGFRGKRADRIKLLWWDGQGFCLFYKLFGTRILSVANSERRRCAPDAGAAF